MACTPEGYVVEAPTPAQLTLARRHLTVAPAATLPQPFPKKFRVFAEAGGRLRVPRFWGLEHLGGAAPYAGPAGEPMAPGAAAFRGALREDLRQPEAARAVLRSFESSGGGGVLVLPTGFGKTTVALWLAAQLGRKTLVLVHKDFLKQQWIERVAQCLPGARTSVVQGPAADTGGDVVVAMIQTVITRAFPPGFWDPFGLLIVDEAHHVAAECFSRAMAGLSFARVLGLSATPTRKDGLTRLLHWFLGPVAFEARRENATNVAVHVLEYTCERYQGPVPVNRRGDVCFTGLISALVDDADRTRRVAEAAEAQARAGHDVLVLSHRRAHCQALAAELAARGVDAGLYLGGCREVPASKVLVATYALTSEGFDCPRLSALVLATPASDVVQACGRILRGGGASGTPTIVDVLDRWGPCWAQAAKRRAYYRRAGFSVAGAQQPSSSAAYAFLDEECG